MKRTIRSMIGRIIMFFYILYAYSEVYDEELNPREVRSEEHRTSSSFKAILEMIVKKVEHICGLIGKNQKRAYL